MFAVGFGGFLVLFAFVFLIGVVGTVLWVLALISLLRVPEVAWQRAHQDKLVWVLVVVLLHVVGAALYWFIARPELERATTGPSPA